MKTNSSEETMGWAEKMAAALRPGNVLALCGELGSGKTCFVRGLGRGFGLPPSVAVSSPTYVLVHEYRGGRLPLFHFDFYRLQKPEEALDLGLEEYFDGPGVSVVEWADRFPGIFPKHTRWISFKVAGENAREITC